MPAPILATKLYLPPPRTKTVLRPRLIERLNAGLLTGSKLTLISASAGFGKTTLVSEWIYRNAEYRMMNAEPESAIQHSSFNNQHFHVAWLSLDSGDNDITRFLSYLIAALQTIAPDLGAGAFAVLQTPQPPPAEALLTSLLNEIAKLPDNFILVLDDYHVIESQAVDQALIFLTEHLPPQLRLVIATREDPQLPLARYRVRGQLNELRAADLRFTPAEAAEFLNQVMGLSLTEADVAALEKRTEGWIAGLQLAALSMQGQPDTVHFIQSFTGSHHFVLDYLLEEVLQRQPESVQTFLLSTSILERMCGPLCEAVLGDKGQGTGDDAPYHPIPSISGQQTLEFLERANLFIVPLDNQRRWYRYHHLFGDLLRQRLGQTLSREAIAESHIRASGWYENNGLVFEAFRHATAANDIERAERLVESREMPIYLRSVALAVLDWLASLPASVLEARPSLRVKSATLSLVAGQTTGVEEKLQAAERTLQDTVPDDFNRDLLGKIACARATLALTRYDPETMLVQSQRALEYLHPDNLAFRFTASWVLSAACLFQGERAMAAKACLEGLAISHKSGDVFSIILATSSLGLVRELENQLPLAAETYQQVLALFGEHPLPNSEEACLGLARISYEWNDLEAAEQYGQRALQMARLYDRVIDRFILSEVFLARLLLVRGDVKGAADRLAQTEQTARQKNFLLRLPEIAAAQVFVLLKQGNIPAAAHLSRQFDLPLSQARVLLAQDKPSAALAVLEPFRQMTEARGWADERLRALVLQAVALNAVGEKDRALSVLAEALELAEPGGFIRLFVDEGDVMRSLISDASALLSTGFRFSIEKQSSQLLAYADKLLAAFPTQSQKLQVSQSTDSLSPRELEILRLIAQGLSNQEIGVRLFLALDTVKGHNRRIFDKLQVQRRTEAIARARELGLL